MELIEAQQLAKELMQQHNVSHYHFKFDNAVRRFGYCNYSKKTISLSKKIVSLNDQATVKNVILHEIAHAMLGHGYGHNATWVRTAKSIGCDGKRCYSRNEVSTPKLKYSVICTNCKGKWKRAKKPIKGLACGSCCKKFNGGKYSKEFIFEIVLN